MRTSVATVGSKCPFLSMNPSQKASYMLNFAGQCPFLSMVNAQAEHSRPITSTPPLHEPLAAQHASVRPIPFEFDDQSLPEELEIQRSVENEIEKEFQSAKRNGHRHQPTLPLQSAVEALSGTQAT